MLPILVLLLGFAVAPRTCRAMEGVDPYIDPYVDATEGLDPYLPQHIRVSVAPRPCPLCNTASGEPDEQPENQPCETCGNEGSLEVPRVNGFYTLIDHEPNADGKLYRKDGDPTFFIERICSIHLHRYKTCAEVRLNSIIDGSLRERRANIWQWKIADTGDQIAEREAIYHRNKTNRGRTYCAFGTSLPCAGGLMASIFAYAGGTAPCWVIALTGTGYGVSCISGMCLSCKEEKYSPDNNIYMTVTIPDTYSIIAADQTPETRVTDVSCYSTENGHYPHGNQAVLVTDLDPELAFRKYVDEQTSGQLPRIDTRGWLVEGVPEYRVTVLTEDEIEANILSAIANI